MSIAELITSIANKVKGIKDNVLAAYDAIASKGGEMPEEKSTENLPATISKLQVKKPEVPIRSITFIDFDGTVLYSYSVKEYAKLTELPPCPTNWKHLNFIGWTHTLEETQNNREQIIGAMYELKEPEKSYLTIMVNNYECAFLKKQTFRAYVDWGDGTPIEVYDNANTTYTHKYERNGEYEICIWGDVQDYVYLSCPIIYNFSDKISGLNSSGMFCYDPTRVGYPNYEAKVMYRLGEGLGTFVNLTGLEWLVVTDKLTATSINISASSRLKGCNFNDNITSIASRQNLKCFQLMRIPNNSTYTMGAGTFLETGLKEIYVPNTISSFPNSRIFLVSLNIIHIQRSVVADGSITIMPSDAFGSTFIKIYVPADSVDAYKEATNWSIYADSIFPEEESI